MITKLEGLLVSKIPFEERHIIGNILLRSGKLVSIVFYGGRGGGKNQKPSSLEIGYMYSIELREYKAHAEIYHAKEWTVLWQHLEIRKNFQAFYLLCFYSEVILKISPHAHLQDHHHEYKEMEGIFTTISNSIFMLEKKASTSEFYLHSHLVIFLIKLFLYMGIYPERENCTLCGADLKQFNDMFLISEEGGFACPPCLSARKTSGVQSGRELWEIMGHISHKKFQELLDFKLEHKSISKLLFHYFCFQFHLEEKDFKSAPMVF